ncbi:MAG: hypothetical protein H5T86_01675 [Armatimonadetes bacterium]|nr:hypothetical protein [Armatimonadota bacterium]
MGDARHSEGCNFAHYDGHTKRAGTVRVRDLTCTAG